MNPTDTMVNAALEALEGRMIDGRKFWTDEDRLLMKAAIRAAIMADLVVLGIGAGNESPTYDELYSGEWEHPRISDHG